MGLTDTDKLIESLTRKSIKEEILGFHESASLINRLIDEVKDAPTCDIEDVYNKAIDDFAALLKKMANESSTYYIRLADYNTNSDLRFYNEVLMYCHKGEAVSLTKNGRGRFVVMDIEDYERDRAEKKLLMKLQEAEEAVKDGEGWLDLDELKALVGE